MKQIEEYIESNKKLLKKAIEKRKRAYGEEEKRLMIQIERLDYYIKGLEDAKKYIEEESEVK